ncbi:DUF803-domain-containing protein [Phlegmacium glaucopus]|nr:DUF803-domain-containing protein [Phlegmacium glaucopus]
MSSTSAAVTATAAASTTSAATLTANANLKIVGIVLAITSGLLIGSSFVFKKKGLLRSQAGGELGEGVAYLKSPLWWLGMSMMILGELCNFAAYAFVEALVVTPLGALSVVVCAILSSIFLKEKLTFFGWLGCALCILGSVIIALNGPQEPTIGKITVFQKLFLAPGFLSFTGVLIAAALVIIFYFAPKYGKKSMLWYIFVCSMIGGISVSVTTGLGAAIVETARGDNQFKFGFIYFLFAFVVVTLLVEVYYLNVALALFNTAMVTPTYYVIFTFFSILTSIVLFQGLSATPSQIITLVMGFLVICVGITVLQMSKVDPEKLNKLDRRSTMLLQVARSQAGNVDEKNGFNVEDPGMDTLRGSFGAVGSIIRARTRKRMSQNSQNSTHLRMRPTGAAAPHDPTVSVINVNQLDPSSVDVLRHQLYDPPVPRDDTSSLRDSVLSQPLSTKRPTIKFDSQDVVHSYKRPGTGDNTATHEHRQAQGGATLRDGYPPLATVPGNEKEINLLDTDPTVPRGATTPQVIPKLPPPHRGQLLNIPSSIASEPTIHSAPPTTREHFARVAAPQPTRVDVKDLFDSNSGRGTLLSFPSVTDSAPSEWGSADAERESHHAKDKKEKSRERVKSPKRYPRGTVDDDEEETEILFRKGAASSEGSDNRSETPPLDVSGIRLVSINQREYF